MTSYQDYRQASDLLFAEGSNLPTQECHLVSLNWASEPFWEVLGAHIGSLSSEIGANSRERSARLIERDRHLQAILDLIPHLASPNHKAALLERSVHMCADHNLLQLSADELWCYSLDQLLSDLGAGGINTLADWAVEIYRISPGTLSLLDQSSPELQSAWVIGLIIDQPSDVAQFSRPVAEKICWRLMVNLIAKNLQGIDSEREMSSLREINESDLLHGFPGWGLLHLIDEAQGWARLPASRDPLDAPFGIQDLRVGRLLWESPGSGVLSPSGFQRLLELESQDPAHFALQISRKNQFNVGRNLIPRITEFVSSNQDIFLQIDLDVEGFKNLEKFGVSQSVLRRHPQAKQGYLDAVMSRDLGL